MLGQRTRSGMGTRLAVFNFPCLRYRSRPWPRPGLWPRFGPGPRLWPRFWSRHPLDHVCMARG